MNTKKVFTQYSKTTKDDSTQDIILQILLREYHQTNYKYLLIW